jgi:hypothetical protein
VPPGVRLELVGDLAGPGADDEPEPVVLQGQQVRRGQHPGVGHDHDVVCLVAAAEPGQDRDQGLGLGLVALEQVHFQREPGGGGDQPDGDLRAGAVFLAHPDPAQLVLPLSFEVQRRDVVRVTQPGVADVRVFHVELVFLFAVKTNGQAVWVPPDERPADDAVDES